MHAASGTDFKGRQNARVEIKINPHETDARTGEAQASKIFTYQQLKELSSIAYDEVAGAAGSSGVPWESRSVGKRDEGRLVPMLHEEFPDVP